MFEKTGNNVLYYIRNDVGALIGFNYNNTNYYYVKNAQYDIIAILDNNYNIVARYQYDSWGNVLKIIDADGNDVSNDNSHIANINPFRYRSYYYDKETNLYYLESRYYSPEMGRFINADSTDILFNDLHEINPLLAYNLYSYANNNPINLSDPEGDNPVAVVCALALAALRRVGSWAVKYGYKAITNWLRRNFKVWGPNGSGNIVGAQYRNKWKVMLHRPHKGNHNFWHIQYEVKQGRKWKAQYRIRIWPYIKVYK